MTVGAGVRLGDVYDPLDKAGFMIRKFLFPFRRMPPFPVRYISQPGNIADGSPRNWFRILPRYARCRTWRGCWTLPRHVRSRHRCSRLCPGRHCDWKGGRSLREEEPRPVLGPPWCRRQLRHCHLGHVQSPESAQQQQDPERRFHHPGFC